MIVTGPGAPSRGLVPTPDVREAKAVTRRHATTFALASRLLPRSIRGDVYLLYMVLRTLDDLVDERQPEAAERVAAVTAWAQGRPHALTQEVELLDGLVHRHAIDRRSVADFCSGMSRDLRGERLATEVDLDRYCYEVAGTVGIMMSALLGTDGSPEARTAAAALGMAMQRTNILRDLDEDSGLGRVFVSQEMVARYGWPSPGHRAAFVRDQIERADRLYDEGLAGVAHLHHGRRAVAAAGQMYREILREIECRDGGELPGRAVVSGPRRLRVGLRAVCRPLRSVA
jgi:phytoene synthase